MANLVYHVLIGQKLFTRLGVQDVVVYLTPCEEWGQGGRP